MTEKEILEQIDWSIHVHALTEQINGGNASIKINALIGLLDLYKQEKQKNKELSEEVTTLREDIYVYRQLIRMENKREYRSKFLKEFQAEHGKTVFPDYDEIYKRYDKLKRENNKLSKAIADDFISKDKIKEQLEGYKAKTDCTYCNTTCDSYVVCKFCEELLEEGNLNE